MFSWRGWGLQCFQFVSLALLNSNSATHGCFCEIVTLVFYCSQLPYLLLNSTGADPKTRMYPVFFGESIEVNPKPEQEIK